MPTTNSVSSSSPSASAVAPNLSPAIPVSKMQASTSVDVNQVAANAISTTLSISSFTLGGLGIIIAVLALVGWSEIRSRAKSSAERIANKRFSDYIESEKFKDFARIAFDESVSKRWQDSIVAKGLTEDQRNEDDPPPFEEKGDS